MVGQRDNKYSREQGNHVATEKYPNIWKIQFYGELSHYYVTRINGNELMSVLDWLNAWMENCVLLDRPANRSGSSMHAAFPLTVFHFFTWKGPEPNPTEINSIFTNLKLVWGLSLKDL